MTLVHLFISFFKIGLFSFGGGYAVISFLQQEVERRGWMGAEQFVRWQQEQNKKIGELAEPD